ncbi:WD40-repeat-containing domain protein, partial [Amanita muscaria]
MQKYKQQITFRGHSRPINSIQFSLQGSYLASGADDGYVYVWSLSTGRISDKFNARQGPVVSIEWLDYPSTVDTQHLISAGADGTVKLWKREKDWTKTKFSFMAMYSVYDKAIENIALYQNQLAVVGGGQLVVFQVDASRLEEPFVPLTKEPKGDDGPMPALARTVHWIQSGRALLVGYLDAKLICAWDTSPWKKNWQHKIATRIGNTAWSEESQTLLVWNLYDGIDVYRIDKGPIWIAKLAMNISRNMVVQMSFVSEPNYAVSGSDNGDVYVWDISTHSPQQVLHH